MTSVNKITYAASLSSTSKNTDTYNIITNSRADTSNNLISNLSTNNYPPDQVPSKDVNGYLLPNANNQSIFKNQPLSWWIDNLNSGNIEYRPISNTVNWAFNEIYILFDISKLIIPNKTKNVVTNPDKSTTITYQDNNYLLMTSNYPSPFANMSINNNVVAPTPTT
jgi:hypothetical protein